MILAGTKLTWLRATLNNVILFRINLRYQLDIIWRNVYPVMHVKFGRIIYKYMLKVILRRVKHATILLLLSKNRSEHRHLWQFAQKIVKMEHMQPSVLDL